MTTIKEIFEGGKELRNQEVMGQIVEVSIKETRNKSFNTKLGIYDGTSSIHVSAFFDQHPGFEIGQFVKVKGDVKFDNYNKGELTFKPRAEQIKLIEDEGNTVEEEDGMGDLKRVSLQNYTFMTSKRGANPVESFFKKAKQLGHEAIGITDLSVVQTFPEMTKLEKKYGIKAVYGMTGLLAKETVTVYNDKNDKLSKDIVVFDVETTGFSARDNDVIELGAVKVRTEEKQKTIFKVKNKKARKTEKTIYEMKIVDTFQSFLKTDQVISEFIQELTKITPEIIEENGREPKVVCEEFDQFVGDSLMAAHNAWFDLHMLEELYRKNEVVWKKRPLIDTLKISRKVNEESKMHSLTALAKKYKIDIKNAHRADEDAKGTAEILIIMLNKLREAGIYTTTALNEFKKESHYKAEFPKEMSIWVKNQTGLKNLYEIVSYSHTKQLNGLGSIGGQKRPILTWDLLDKNKEGLIYGSGGYNSNLFEFALNKPDEVIEEEIKKYDIIQIEPVEVGIHLVNSERPQAGTVEQLKNAWRRIVELAQKHKKFIVATDGAHYTQEEDSLVHNILIYSQLPPKRDHSVRAAKMDYPMGKAKMLTTKEMYEAMDYLTEEEKEMYIVKNPNKFLTKIEKINPVPVDEKGEPVLYAPKIEGTDENFRAIVMQEAIKKYGNPLPTIISLRLEKELKSIIGNGFAVIYMISRELVKKSLNDGYLVGSRGSIGSSLAATMSEITEVNPMSPHYVCKECKWSLFIEGNEEILSGYDLPVKFGELLKEENYSKESIELTKQLFAKEFNTTVEKISLSMESHSGECPKCKKESLERDGQNIPFETFLGFNGDKVPDIDLNFSGVYQPVAHAFTKEMFGEKFVYRAGTITTIAEKTANSFARNYYKNHEVIISSAEINRVGSKIKGAKDSTGQHPGGILVVPNYMEMTDFSPYQYPANNEANEFMTSHFDFHSIHDNILKLDILGHDAPTLLRFLQEYTDVDPKTVPSADPKALNLFGNAEKSLGVHPESFLAKTGTLGMPEMGTRVVQDVISETSPMGFGDLITLSGLTHGTDVYYNNAQDLIKEGTATIREVIGCRDDIMRYLISKKMDESLSFKIMESVRKGKGLTEEWEEEMVKFDVPEWYIWSCKQIKYMFPRAHAAAYVLDATRIGYYKAYYPLEFYAAVFSSRFSDEDIMNFMGTAEEIKGRMEECKNKIDELNRRGEENAAGKVKRTRVALNIALEAKLRGINFGTIELYSSHQDRYLMNSETNTLIPPFTSIVGLGATVATKIYEERKNGVFKGVRDLKKRTKANETTILVLDDLGCLDEVKELQPTLF